VALLNATSEYKTNQQIKFSCKDYGGFVKSPVGNLFSDKFVIFSMLCQIQFVLYCVEEYILDDCSTKLRFSYLQYYYCLKVIDEMNSKIGTSFQMDTAWESDQFRNAMAHYKVGIALKPEELIIDDPLFGMTQKYFHSDYFTVKQAVLNNLFSLAEQLKTYLKLN